MNLDKFFRQRWKTILGVFLITLGVDALINNQMVYSSLPPQVAGAFQFYYKEPVTKTLPPYLAVTINWPFFTTILIGVIFAGWDFVFREKKKETGETQ